MKAIIAVCLALLVVATAGAPLAAVPSSASPAAASARDDGDVRVRPGQLFLSTGGGGCTVGFLLQELGEDGVATGTHWAMAAGHCFNFEGTSRRWAPGEGPTVSVRDREVGEAAYAHIDWPNGVDVAGIRLSVDAGHLDPSVCFFGGPTGLREDDVTDGETLLLSGRGRPLHPREMTATADQDPWVSYRGTHGGGDSGSPVMDASGRAVGLHARGGISYPTLSTGDAAKVGDMIRLLEKELDIRLQLLTAPRNDVEWPRDVLADPCSHNIAVGLP